MQLKRIHPLDVPLEVFLADLSKRAANVIRAEMQGFDSYGGTGTFDIEPPYTVRHLCMFGKVEMKRWPNFGKKCLNEVCEMLRERGLQLWDKHDERSLRLLREHPMYFKQYEDQITRLQDELSPQFDDKSDGHGWSGDRYMSVSGCIDEHDARMIAASPELLEALTLLVAGIENSVSKTYIPLVRANAAIAKATGSEA